MQSINLKAPVKCSKKIIINAHSVDVWEVLTDIDKWSSWQTDIKKSKLDGAPEPGTTFSWKSNGIKINSTLHTVTPYTEFGWTGKGFGITAIHNWKITELNKQTEVAVEESMDGLVVKVFKILLNKNLEKGMMKWLELLKKKVEKPDFPEQGIPG